MIKSEEITEIALKFTTAWVAPIPVVKALSVLYPRLGFILEYYSFESMVTGTFYLNGNDEFVFEEYNLQEQQFIVFFFFFYFFYKIYQNIYI